MDISTLFPRLPGSLELFVFMAFFASFWGAFAWSTNLPQDADDWLELCIRAVPPVAAIVALVTLPNGIYLIPVAVVALASAAIARISTEELFRFFRLRARRTALRQYQALSKLELTFTVLAASLCVVLLTVQSGLYGGTVGIGYLIVGAVVVISLRNSSEIVYITRQPSELLSALFFGAVMPAVWFLTIAVLSAPLLH